MVMLPGSSSSIHSFTVPYVSFNIGTFLYVVILVILVYASLRAQRRSFWQGLTAVALIAPFIALIFTGSIGGGPGIRGFGVLPIEYASPPLEWIELDYGEALFFSVVPGSGFGPSGSVIWQGTVMIPDCAGECVLPSSGVLYRCDAYGFEEVPMDTLANARWDRLAAEQILSSVDAPCRIAHTGDVYTELYRRS